MKFLSILIVCVLCLLNLIQRVNGQEFTQPNMVVILVDDHAFEAISAYGAYLKDYARTPSIDRIANEGMRFDGFSCNNSICSPSRASILTGQYSHKNGVQQLNGTINVDSPQYPDLLQKAGYQTWLVGKWHLHSAPLGYEKHMTVKGQGKYFNPKFTGTEGTWERTGYATDVYTDVAMEWLKNRDRNKPFLLSLQFKAPHHDYGHAERYDDLFSGIDIPEPPTLYEDVRNSNSNLKKDFLKNSKFHMVQGSDNTGYYHRHLDDAEPDAMGEIKNDSNKEKIRVAYQHQIHKYIRCIAGNDDNVKRVLDYLDDEGIAENTIVVYTSDQGYWLGQHGFYDKRLILETSMRMPFLIRYPKLIKPGSTNNELCMNVDIAPTLLELAGVEIPKSMQGQSMVPILKGSKTPKNWRKAQFYNYWRAPFHYGIRTKRFTYVKVKDHDAELFDNKLDPNQCNNVASDSKYKKTIARLEAELQNQIKVIGIKSEELPGASEPKRK